MTEPIRIEVEFEGGRAAASGVDQVSDALGDLERRQQAASVKAIELTTKIAGAASAVQSLTSALGMQGRTVGLIGSIAQTSAATAQLGATFGPQGALVGGITGALIPALSAVVDSLRELDREYAAQRTAVDSLASSNDELAESYERVLESMRRVQAQAAREQRLGMGLGSAQEQAALVETRRQELARLEAMEAGYNRTLQSGSASLDQQAAASRLREVVRREIRAARAALNEALAAESAAQADLAGESEDLMAGLVADAAGAGRGGRSGARGSQDDAAIQRGLQQEEEARLRVADAQERQLWLIKEISEKADEEAAEVVAAALRTQDALDRIDQERREREKQQEREAEEKAREIARANDEALEAHRAQVMEYQEVTGVIVGGLTDALKSIVTGEQTAEQAFKNLLASFLAYISEQATLKASFEAAEAIAAFASQDYAGGAGHLAAAVAYGAVAVAAGAGSAALSASASASSQAEPERGRSQGSGDRGGGSVVINWNSPVVTGQTRAELGRELSQMVAAGQRRFGTV